MNRRRWLWTFALWPQVSGASSLASGLVWPKIGIGVALSSSQAWFWCPHWSFFNSWIQTTENVWTFDGVCWFWLNLKHRTDEKKRLFHTIKPGRMHDPLHKRRSLQRKGSAQDRSHTFVLQIQLQSCFFALKTERKGLGKCETMCLTWVQKREHSIREPRQGEKRPVALYEDDRWT